MPVMIIQYLVQDLPEREGETLVSVVDRTRKIVGGPPSPRLSAGPRVWTFSMPRPAVAASWSTAA